MPQTGSQLDHLPRGRISGFVSSGQAREAQRRRDDEARQAEIADAVTFIEAWNARLAAGRPVLFSPTWTAGAR